MICDDGRRDKMNLCTIQCWWTATGSAGLAFPEDTILEYAPGQLTDGWVKPDGGHGFSWETKKRTAEKFTGLSG